MQSIWSGQAPTFMTYIELGLTLTYNILRSLFNASILLLRDPLESILSEYNRQAGGHTGHAKKMEKWPGFVMEKISVWGKMNSDWIDNFPRDKLLILSYSQLVSDLPGQLRRLASFLKISLTDADMDCVVTNSQGVFKREKKSQRITLSKDIQLKVESVKLNVTLKAQKHNPTIIL